MRVDLGLNAVIVAVTAEVPRILTVARPGSEAAPEDALPFGPLEPETDRTLDLGLRRWVREQTGLDLGYVEQLYTFGDEGRDAPLADLGPGAARVISVGYLALAPQTAETDAQATGWAAWPRLFPWEDWRRGRPALIEEVVAPALSAWAHQAGGADAAARGARARLLFAQEGAPWNEERVLERFELLYEAGLLPEAARDRQLAPSPVATDLGLPMLSDHRRILATGLARLRGKIRYRPVIFELTPPRFTLLRLQRAVEAISGVRLHKQNFRRAVERTGLIEGLGRMDAGSGGRPAELFRFRRELLGALPVSGLSLPMKRE